MSKVNFTKVEEMLSQGLHKINVNDLLVEADAVKTGSTPPTKTTSNSQLINSVQRDLKLLHKKDHETYVKLGIKKNFLKKMIETPDSLTPEELETLKQIQEKIKVFKEELKNTLPPINDEAIVESQRTKHINKRYNVNDKWLPLQ
jgi:hypothetical protein